MKMKKTFWLVPLMFLAAVSFTACGEDEDGTKQGSGNTTSKSKYIRVSTERIVVPDGAKVGSRYYGNAYKYTYSNGSTKLTLGSNGESLIGYASKNSDSVCYGVTLSKKYKYKVVKYDIIYTSYYYFN